MLSSHKDDTETSNIESSLNCDNFEDQSDVVISEADESMVSNSAKPNKIILTPIKKKNKKNKKK